VDERPPPRSDARLNDSANSYITEAAWNTTRRASSHVSSSPSFCAPSAGKGPWVLAAEGCNIEKPPQLGFLTCDRFVLSRRSVISNRLGREDVGRVPVPSAEADRLEQTRSLKHADITFEAFVSTVDSWAIEPTPTPVTNEQPLTLGPRYFSRSSDHPVQQLFLFAL
jgi:hypothetical protein